MADSLLVIDGFLRTLPDGSLVTDKGGAPCCCGEPEPPCPFLWRVVQCGLCTDDRNVFVCSDFSCKKDGPPVSPDDVLHWDIYCGSIKPELGKFVPNPHDGSPPPDGFKFLPDGAFVIKDATCVPSCDDPVCQPEECDGCCMRYRIHRKTSEYDCQGLASTYEITRWGSYDSNDGYVTGFYKYEIFNFRTGAHEIQSGEDFNPWSSNPGYCNPAYPDVFAEVAVGFNTPCPDGTRPWYDSPSGTCGTPKQGLVYIWSGLWDVDTGGSFTWTKDEYTQNCNPPNMELTSHSVGDGEWTTSRGRCKGKPPINPAQPIPIGLRPLLPPRFPANPADPSFPGAGLSCPRCAAAMFEAKCRVCGYCQSCGG